MFTIKTIPLEDVIEMLERMSKARFGDIRYYSIPQTIDGRIIYKISGGTIKTKFDHTHDKRYKEPSYHRKDNSTYIVSQAIKHNDTTGNTLLFISPQYESTTCNGKPIKAFGKEVQYLDADGNLMEESEAKKWIKPKKYNGEPSPYLTVNAKQIIKLNKVIS